jgi:hypothetical protein
MALNVDGFAPIIPASQASPLTVGMETDTDVEDAVAYVVDTVVATAD